MTRIRVLHIVNDLSQHGGAEMTLLRLLESLGEERKTHAIVTLKPLREGNMIGASIIALGIPMEDLGVDGVLSIFGAYFRLVGLIRRVRPAGATSSAVSAPSAVAAFSAIQIRLPSPRTASDSPPPLGGQPMVSVR